MRSSLLLTFDEVGEGDTIYASLELDIREDRTDILAKGMLVATMNKRSHHALTSSSPRKPLIFRLNTQARAQSKTRPSFEIPPTGTLTLTCAMAVLVFGPRSIANMLGRSFSRQKLFLQHPYSMSTHITYENPQYFGMVEPCFLNGADLPPYRARQYPSKSSSAREVR